MHSNSCSHGKHSHLPSHHIFCFVSFFRQRQRSLWKQVFFKVWTLLEINLFNKDNLKPFPTPSLHVQTVCRQIPDLKQDFQMDFKINSLTHAENQMYWNNSLMIIFLFFFNRITLAAAHQVLKHSLVIFVPVYSGDCRAVFSFIIPHSAFKFFWEFHYFLISHMNSGSWNNIPILIVVRQVFTGVGEIQTKFWPCFPFLIYPSLGMVNNIFHYVVGR